jgi:hypothetical protein
LGDRSTEEFVRAMSNLVESLHHSITLYILSSTSRLAAIGIYFYAIAILALPLALKISFQFPFPTILKKLKFASRGEFP